MTDHTSAVERLHAQWERVDALTKRDRWQTVQLAAAIKQDSEAGAVAWTSETQLRAVQLMGDGVMASEPSATWDIPLYTRPAAALPEVDDAMVERARDAKLPNGDRVHQHITTVWERTVLTAALTAALRPETQG